MWGAMLTALLDFVIKWLRGDPAERAGAAKAEAKMQEQAREDQAAAVRAGDAVRADIATDDGLRDHMANDPNNRDRH